MRVSVGSGLRASMSPSPSFHLGKHGGEHRDDEHGEYPTVRMFVLWWGSVKEGRRPKRIE